MIKLINRMIALSLILVFITAGCTPKTTEPESPFSDWLTTANLNALETPEELYAAALGEDMLVVYSTSTRMMDVAESFESAYPRLIVRVEHIRENELYGKLLDNYETGDFDIDLICSADGRGIMVNELLPKGIAVKYVPHDIKDKLLPGNDEDLLMMVGEAPMLGYNTTSYHEPPINNWWELTTEEWHGMVYIPNPSRSVTTLAFLTMVENNSDMMAAAYEDLFGQPLELANGESAGREFVRRLVENDVVIVNSSDEVAEEIGYPGSQSPSLGIIASSKVRLRDLGYENTNHYGMKPFAGVYSPISIMMAGGAKNVNTAKLFIRWLLGEADGQGEGYKPYLQSGAWSVRSDAPDGYGVRPDELHLLRIDAHYMYDNYDAFLAFWESLLEAK